MYYDGCLWKKRNFLKLQVFIFIILTIAPLLVTCYGLKGTNFFPQFLNFMGLSENFVQWRVYNEIQSPFSRSMQERRSTLVTTRQRSSGKVMLSVLSVSQTVCSQGPHVITHGHVQPCLLGNHDPDPDTSAAPYPHGTPSRSQPPCTYAFIWKFSVSLRLKGLLFSIQRTVKDSTHVGSSFASDTDEKDDHENGAHTQTHTGNTDQHEADRVRLSVEQRRKKCYFYQAKPVCKPHPWNRKTRSPEKPV